MRIPRLAAICMASGGALFVLSWTTALQPTAPTPPRVQPSTAATSAPLPTLSQRARPLAMPASVAPAAEAATVAKAVESAASPGGHASPTIHASSGAPLIVAGSNASAPGLPLDSVAASSANGRMSPACEVPSDAAAKRALLRFVPAATAGGRPGCLEQTHICAALRHALAGSSKQGARGADPARRHQLLVSAAVGEQRDVLSAFTEAAAALRVPTLILAMDADAFVAAQATSAAAVLLDDASALPLARKWAALAAVLEAGVEVLWADVDAVLATAPFEHLHADTDLSALSEGWEEPYLRGHIMGADDPSMGWSRYCESMRIALLSPAIVHMLPTTSAVAVARRMAAFATAEGWASARGAAWAGDASEALALSTELLLPAHDDTSRVGAKPSDEAWPINCQKQPQVCEAVKGVAKDRAVMVAVSNRNILGMLGQFVDTVQTAGVSNFLVVALDQSTADFLKRKRAAHYLRSLRSRSGSTDNHATSGLKFHILAELLSVGVSVLLTDVDVVLTQDPFPALYRDTDAEGMTDGWDDDSAYGHLHELPMGSTGMSSGRGGAWFRHGGGAWTAGGADASGADAKPLPWSAIAPGSARAPLRTLRMVARNSGLFYLSATVEALKLMEILASRMASEEVWDQSAYNMEIARPAYGAYQAAGVSVRSMNYLCFCNTKLVFKVMRYDPQLGDETLHRPVTVHINYHPEKEARMVSVSAFYHQHRKDALDKWNGGEGTRSGSCVGKVGVHSNSFSQLGAHEATKHLLVANLLKADEEWVWEGQAPFKFQPDGTLSSASYAGGTWGTVPSPWRKDSLHVTLPGDKGGTHLLMFLSEKWSFVAVRCADEKVSYGAVRRPDVPEKRLVF